MVTKVNTELYSLSFYTILSNIRKLYTESVSISKKPQCASLLKEYSIFFSLPPPHPTAHWCFRLLFLQSSCITYRTVATAHRKVLIWSKEHDQERDVTSPKLSDNLLCKKWTPRPWRSELAAHFNYSPLLPKVNSTALSELVVISSYLAWNITPALGFTKDMFSTTWSFQLLLLGLGTQNIEGWCTGEMKENMFLKISLSFLYTHAILQTLKQIPARHNTFTSCFLGVLRN